METHTCHFVFLDWQGGELLCMMLHYLAFHNVAMTTAQNKRWLQAGNYVQTCPR